MEALNLRRTLMAVLSLLLAAVQIGGQEKPTRLNCQTTCVCASNIISCTNANLSTAPEDLPPQTAVLDLSFNSITRLRHKWAPQNLGRLHRLILSNNRMDFLSTEAFVHVRNLTYLDLSFNSLRQLDELIFEPLERLKVLLLFKNNISQIDRSAFEGLNSLQKLYMSHNQISRFPLEVLKEQSRQTFQLLDVSSNRFKTLQLQELRALRAWIKNGVYFHNNPLTCSCELYEFLAQWSLKKLSSAVDFKGNHTCVIPGVHREIMLILDLDKAYLNCSEVEVLKQEAYLEQSIKLDCDTRQRNVIKRWELPENTSLSLANKTAEILSNGNLQIGPLRSEHSGLYTCYATGESFNETLHITVVVFNSTLRGGLENLKTAYTTLVACLISIVMVIIYLYFTPCPCCPGQGEEKDDPGDSFRSSNVSLAKAHDETGQWRAEGGGFPYGYAVQPGHKGQLEENGGLDPIGEEDEEWHENKRKRRRSEAESVCSDTPMVV